ncbi:MAG: hypothetical protein DCF25_16045 [Leptolyngbya foveolarum]|uniref:Uncharacterized protein n=1 Tax=Leptolyngbya foveolarum TaxID=47253 RepID=A0A2W4TWU2_9CYAN|nr:MAG: hypothetical protein DCF25_16045 [Leptolyngbya foveolarum]
MTTDLKSAPPTDNPLGIQYERPHQKIVRVSKIQQFYKQSPKLAVALALILTTSIGVSAFRLLASPQTVTVAKQESLPIDTDSILSGSESSLDALKSQSVAQLETYREQLLSTKAERFLMEARKQIDDKQSNCFMQQITCPLNQFQAEAIAQLETARAAGDYDGLLRAADRALIVEYARANHTDSSEPEHALTQVAIDNLVRGYQTNAAATAEAKAAELTE